MKQHFSKFWLHYFAIAVCIWFIYKLYKDNKGAGGTGNGNPAPSVLDYSKTISTGSSSEEVKAAQAYINMHMDSAQLQANPLVEDGLFGPNTTTIIEALFACEANQGWNPTGTVSTTLSEVIILTDSYTCAS